MTDWTSYASKKYVPGTKSKARQRNDKEDRTIIYRDWRREFPKGSPFTTDVDQVEWISHEGKDYPCAIIELTRTDSDDVPQKYLNSIIDRFFIRDSQARYAARAAELLGCEAWLVLFNRDVSLLWVYNLSNPKPTSMNGWWKLSPEQYQEWMVDLAEKKRQKLEKIT